MEQNENGNIDEKKVNLAARFLQDDSVKETDKERKVSFLKTKGLTEEEIEAALLLLHSQPDPEESSWTMFNVLRGVALGLGFLSAANYAYKAYILPYVAKEVNDDKRLEVIVESVQVLQDDIKQHTYELSSTLKQFQSLLEQQQNLLGELTKSAHSTNGSEIKELQSGIDSVKNLLLNSNQFPATPFASKTTTKVIPAWQIATKADPLENTTVATKSEKSDENKKIDVEKELEE